ncbi:MAG TPA: hypothetical protein DCL73_14065 [Treponema sp.]|nr:hypothetical protein [Treponema sp.]
MQASMYSKRVIYFLPVVSFPVLFQTAAFLRIIEKIDWNAAPQDPILQTFAVILVMMFCLLSIYLISQTYVQALLFIISILCSWFIIQELGTTERIGIYVLLALASEIPIVFSDYLGLVCLCVMLAVQFSAFREHAAAQFAAENIPVRTFVFLAVYSSLLAGFGLLYRYLVNKLTDMRHEVSRMATVMDNISNTNLEYQNYVSTVERSAVEKERQRISREIHDIIGYTMINTLMLIQAAQTSSDERQVHALLDKAQMHLAESVDEARLSLYKLRDEKLDMLHGKELFSKLTKAFSEITGVKILADFGNLPDHISEDAEKVLFRMLEESMTNTFKHGNASYITIHFLYKDDAISLRIFDNGTNRLAPGMEIKEGIGLSGMRERLEPLHGTLSAGYVKDGFLLYAVIPEPGEQG